MEYIPSATSLRRALEYGAVATIVAFLLASALVPPGILWDGAIFAVVAGVLVYLVLHYQKLKMYGFDERGVYRRGRLLFSWPQVKRLSLGFRNRGGSVTLVAQPTWAALLSGGLFESASYVDYDVTLDFELGDGRKVAIPSNLDRLAGRVLERIDERARSANPRIEFQQ